MEIKNNTVLHICSDICKELIKECVNCKELKKLFLFKKDLKTKNPHKNICLKCHSIEEKTRRIKNYDKNILHDCQINQCNIKQKYCTYCKSNHSLISFGLSRNSVNIHCLCLLKMYKHSSIKRKKSFTLSNKKFWELLNNPCYYCGENSIYKLRGIDRINNDVGYTLKNSVSCCYEDNMAKGSMNYKEYYKLIMRHTKYNLNKIQKEEENVL